MPAEFKLRDEAYLTNLTEGISSIRKEIEEEEKKNDLKAAMTETQTKENFRSAEKSYGVSEKETQDHHTSLQIRKENRKHLVETKTTKLIEELESKLEKIHFGGKGGRLKAMEAAHGPEYPEVIRLKQADLDKAAERVQQVKEAKQRETGISHPPISKEFNDQASKLPLTQEFNKAADRSR